MHFWMTSSRNLSMNFWMTSSRNLSIGDLPYGDGLIYKLDATYTDFEDYSAGAADGNGNKITADLEDVAVKISIGKKF